MKRKIKLQTKITLLVTTVVFVSIAIIIFFAVTWMTNAIESKAETNLLNVAKMIAHSEEIVNALETKDPDDHIAPYADLLLKNLAQVDYIIVVDRDGIRYSHPNPDMIGETFVGGDEARVAQEGETYISEATGTLGKALRAFAPIYDSKNQTEIGFVAVGTLTDHIETAKNTAILYIILISLGALVVGIIGAFVLSNNIKKILLGLEPDEISKLYTEKMGMLEAIHEGLIAIDNLGQITLINDAAINILKFGNKYDKNNLIGHNLDEVIPNTEMIKILKTGNSEFDQEQRIDTTIIVTNRIPIMNEGKIIGAIASFRDKTQVTKLAEELTGVKKLAWSLRAQNHEFMNKLHTISGLIQLEEYDEALAFISEVAKSRNNISDILTNNIKNPYISALLLSKYAKAEECRVKLIIDEASQLGQLPMAMRTEDIVSIIGNLVENSLDEVKNDGTGTVYIKILADDKDLTIQVQDNGSGIAPENWDKIYSQGFSTKKDQRGNGMFIVKNIIDEFGGTISLNCDDGVFWNITIPMKRGDLND
jgi:two-component system CitB family sensor kinase